MWRRGLTCNHDKGGLLPVCYVPNLCQLLLTACREHMFDHRQLGLTTESWTYPTEPPHSEGRSQHTPQPCLPKWSGSAHRAGCARAKKAAI